MEEQPESLWNKKAEDITVGDAIVINLAILAAMVGTAGAIAGATVAYDKLATKFQERKKLKAQKNLEIVK